MRLSFILPDKKPNISLPSSSWTLKEAFGNASSILPSRLMIFFEFFSWSNMVWNICSNTNKFISVSQHFGMKFVHKKSPTAVKLVGPRGGLRFNSLRVACPMEGRSVSFYRCSRSRGNRRCRPRLLHRWIPASSGTPKNKESEEST